MKSDWKHMTNAANRQSQYQDDSDFTIMVICILAGIALTIIWHEELWAWIDWILTVTENFHE